MENDTLKYSEPGINVKPKFYNKKVVVYVEGVDDIPFWQEAFYSVSTDFEIEQVGGFKNLEPYFGFIFSGNRNIIVACDRDHSIYKADNPYNNPLIVTTYGYSIENTMMCPKNIIMAAKRFAKTGKDYSDEVNAWYEEFCEASLQLLPYDVCNYVFEKSVKCFGDNCCRFLKKADADMLDAEKIQTYISTIKDSFTEDELTDILRKIEGDNRDVRFKIKGHFIVNGAVNLIKKIANSETGARFTLSSEAIYALVANCISACNPKCEDRKYLKENIQLAFENLS